MATVNQITIALDPGCEPTKLDQPLQGHVTLRNVPHRVSKVVLTLRGQMNFLGMQTDNSAIFVAPRVTWLSKVFHEQEIILHHTQILFPSTTVSLPFLFKLPSHNLPHTLEFPGGAGGVKYSLHCQLYTKKRLATYRKSSISEVVPVHIGPCDPPLLASSSQRMESVTTTHGLFLIKVFSPEMVIANGGLNQLFVAYDRLQIKIKHIDLSICQTTAFQKMGKIHKTQTTHFILNPILIISPKSTGDDDAKVDAQFTLTDDTLSNSIHIQPILQRTHRLEIAITLLIHGLHLETVSLAIPITVYNQLQQTKPPPRPIPPQLSSSSPSSPSLLAFPLPPHTTPPSPSTSVSTRADSILESPTSNYRISTNATTSSTSSHEQMKHIEQDAGSQDWRQMIDEVHILSIHNRLYF